MDIPLHENAIKYRDSWGKLSVDEARKILFWQMSQVDILRINQDQLTDEQVAEGIFKLQGCPSIEKILEDIRMEGSSKRYMLMHLRGAIQSELKRMIGYSSGRYTKPY